MADRVILACTVIVALVYLYATTLIPTLEIGDPLGPRAFPDLIGIAMLFAAGMLGIEIWRERKEGKQADAQAEPAFEGRVVVVLLGVVIWTGIYYAIFESLGYVIATTIFLLVLMAVFHRGKWLSNVLSSVGFSIVTYWLFGVLDVSLPKGLLPF